MARDNTYTLFSREAYETLPATQSFLDERGPIYFPPADNEEQGEEMTPENATIREAYETKYGVPAAFIVDDEGDVTRCEYEDCNHVILTLPNMTQAEKEDVIDEARAQGVMRPVLLSHKQMIEFTRGGGA